MSQKSTLKPKDLILDPWNSHEETGMVMSINNPSTSLIETN